MVLASGQVVLFCFVFEVKVSFFLFLHFYLFYFVFSDNKDCSNILQKFQAQKYVILKANAYVVSAHSLLLSPVPHYHMAIY